MTILDAVQKLQEEKQNNVTSRFPCRAIMVRNIEQYCQLLSELKKISDIRMVTLDEIFSGADVMPKYSNLKADTHFDEWKVLTGVSEYLHLFSKKEAKDARLASLWQHQVPASSIGRIVIPLWGCEAQWFDPALNLMGDDRQQDFYFDCMDSSDSESQMEIVVLSGLFEQYLSKLGIDAEVVCAGLFEWFEYWQSPSTSINGKFVLLTRQYRNVSEVNGEVTVSVVSDPLSFIRNKMPGASVLTADLVSDEIQNILFEYALRGDSLEKAILEIINVSVFSGIDIMAKWSVMNLCHKQLVFLWYRVHSDNSYLGYCFSISESPDDIPWLIAHEIFQMREVKPEWVEEFRILKSVMSLELDAKYFASVDKISEFERRLDYISSETREERIYLLRMVGQWMRADATVINTSHRLKEVFPALSAYLSDISVKSEGALGAYMSLYRAYKLENTLPGDEDIYFNGIETDMYESRYSVLSDYENDETLFLWIDALGVEWLPLLTWGIQRECSGQIRRVEVAQATLPTETCFNEQWKTMEVAHKKLNKLDKLAHKGVVDEPDYYACIEEQMEFVSTIGAYVDELLKENRRVVITGDHGTSRLAARFFHNKEGVSAPKGASICSHGRYCKLTKTNSDFLCNVTITRASDGNQYAIFRDYNHFKQSGFAAGADDDNAIYGEVHGGATPEEMLVPVVVVESTKELPLAGIWESTAVKINAKKARFVLKFSKPVQQLSVKMGDILGSVSPCEDTKSWSVIFQNVRPGDYSVDVLADGCIVDVCDITLKSALGEETGGFF